MSVPNQCKTIAEVLTFCRSLAPNDWNIFSDSWPRNELQFISFSHFIKSVASKQASKGKVNVHIGFFSKNSEEVHENCQDEHKFITSGKVSGLWYSHSTSSHYIDCDIRYPLRKNWKYIICHEFAHIANKREISRSLNNPHHQNYVVESFRINQLFLFDDQDTLPKKSFSALNNPHGKRFNDLFRMIVRKAEKVHGEGIISIDDFLNHNALLFEWRRLDREARIRFLKSAGIS